MKAERLRALQAAITELKRDPNCVVALRVDDLDLELRVRRAGAPTLSAADLFREAGPWEGDTTEAMLVLLAEARGRVDPQSPPRLPVEPVSAVLEGLDRDRSDR